MYRISFFFTAIHCLLVCIHLLCRRVRYIGQIAVNLAIYTFSRCGNATYPVPAYASIYGGLVVSMGDNRFPWDSRAVRENEDWVPQQRGMMAQQFVFGMAMGWM